MGNNSFDDILRRLSNGENPTPPDQKEDENKMPERHMSSRKRKKLFGIAEDEEGKSVIGISPVARGELEKSNFGIRPVAQKGLDKSSIGFQGDGKGIRYIFSFKDK